jgi:hypothetical protein
VLGNQQWGKTAFSITRHVNPNRTVLGQYRLGAAAVALVGHGNRFGSA